jgi:hypothetical protein
LRPHHSMQRLSKTKQAGMEEKAFRGQSDVHESQVGLLTCRAGFTKVVICFLILKQISAFNFDFVYCCSKRLFTSSCQGTHSRPCTHIRTQLCMCTQPHVHAYVCTTRTRTAHTCECTLVHMHTHVHVCTRTPCMTFRSLEH